MVSFKKYIAEAKISQAEIKRRKAKRSESDENEKEQSELNIDTDTQEVPDEETEDDYEDVSSDEINLNEKHSEKGKLGKSFNNNIIFLNEKKDSPISKKIKNFLSSNSSFFKNDGSLILFNIQDESVEYKGNTYAITTIFPKDVRSKAASFFEEFKTHEEIDFFIALYTVLRNKGVFEETTLKILKRYLPENLLDEDALEKIRSVISEEAIIYQDNRMMIYKSGGGAGKKFSLFSYIVLYHLLSDLRQTVKKKQFKEEVQGIPSSANINIPQFYATRKVGKDESNEAKVDIGKRDSVDNSEFVKDSERNTDETKDTEITAKVSSEEPDKKVDKISKKYENSLKQKVYSGSKIESLDELSTDLENARKTFEEIKNQAISNKFDELNTEFEEKIKNSVGENYKSLKKEINTVKLHGSALGAATMKLSSGDTIRRRAEKAKVDIDLKEEILNEVSKIDKLTYNPGKKETSEEKIMRSRVSKIIKNQNEIISKNKESVKERINKLTLEYTKRFDSHYNKAKNKLEKLSSFKKTIKKPLDQQIIEIGYSINMAKSSASSYASRVESIIKDYRNSLLAISNKIRLETENLEKKQETYNYKVKEKKFQERLSPRLNDIKELIEKEKEIKAETQELVSQLKSVKGKINLANINDDAEERKKFTAIQNKIKSKIEENKKQVEEIQKQKEKSEEKEQAVKNYLSRENSAEKNTNTDTTGKIKTWGSETKEAAKSVIDRVQLKKQFDAVKKEFSQKKTFSANLKDKAFNFLKKIAEMPGVEQTSKIMMDINKKDKKNNQSSEKQNQQIANEEFMFYKKEKYSFLTEDELSNKVASKTAELFQPYKVANDEIFNNLREAVNSRDKDSLVKPLVKIKNILLSGNAPSITIISYTDKMIDFISTIINKIDDLDDKMEDIEYKDCISAINALNNFIETGLTNLQNQLEKSFSQPEQNKEIPAGAKPALTTSNENESEEDEEDEDDEDVKNEPKNLLALAKKKFRSNK